MNFCRAHGLAPYFEALKDHLRHRLCRTGNQASRKRAGATQATRPGSSNHYSNRPSLGELSSPPPQPSTAQECCAMLRQLGQIQGSLFSRSLHAPLAGKFVRASAIAGIGNVPNGTPAGVRLATGSCRRIRIGLPQLARGEGMKIRFVASPKPAAQSTLQEVIRRYGQTDASDAEATVTLGGDGTALKALHAALLTSGPPVFAMRLAGSVGFLANRYDVLGLPERIEAAYQTRVWALEAEVFDVRGAVRTVLGISEIVLRRQQLQAAKLKLSVAGAEQMRLLVGDGLLIATPLGSTGYNRSLGGARLVLDSPLMAMTGACAAPSIRMVERRSRRSPSDSGRCHRSDLPASVPGNHC